MPVSAAEALFGWSFNNSFCPQQWCSATGLARANTEVLLFVSDPAAPGSVSLIMLHDTVGNAGLGGSTKLFVQATRGGGAGDNNEATVVRFDDPGAKNASKEGDWLG